jgi:hypothetical protein
MKNNKDTEFNLDHKHGEFGYLIMIAGLLIILSQFNIFHMLIDSRIFWGIILISLGFVIVSKKYHH